MLRKIKMEKSPATDQSHTCTFKIWRFVYYLPRRRFYHSQAPIPFSFPNTYPKPLPNLLRTPSPFFFLILPIENALSKDLFFSSITPTPHAQKSFIENEKTLHSHAPFLLMKGKSYPTMLDVFSAQEFPCPKKKSLWICSNIKTCNALSLVD